MLIRRPSTALFACALLGAAASVSLAQDKPIRAKFFGEDQLQKKPAERPPKPDAPRVAPEAENYGADYGRDDRVTPREDKKTPAASIAGGEKPAPHGDTFSPSAGKRGPGAADLAGASSTPAFSKDEKPRDSVRSAPSLERVATHAGPSLAAAAAPPGAGGRPAPPSPAMLGQVFDAAPPRAELSEPKPMPRPWADAKAAPGGPGLVNLKQDASPAPVFVAMELDLSANPGQYRDAVAALGKSSGFKLDNRFPPIYRDSRRLQVSVWGWVPSGQVTQALTSPGVARLEAAPQGQAPAAPAAQEGEWRLVLRLPAPKPGSEDPAADFAGTLLRLSEAGFAWKRSEPRDSTGLVAVVGTMPERSLKRVMADPSVVRVEPFKPSPAPAPAPLEASAGPAAQLGRFFSTHPVSVLLLALAPMVLRLLKREA